MTTAYSYVRFSHPDQAKGDSLRRQTERTKAYCQRRGWTFDENLTYRDLGLSAFQGKNAAVGNFKNFLDAIGKKDGVTPGSVLVIEGFDRVTRQGIDEGYELIKRILKAGIRIVTLSPEREFDREAVRGLTKGALEIQLILERAAEESERKSDRVGAAWANKRKNAAEKVLTRRLPGWITLEDGKLALDNAKAATVKRLFRMVREGMGVHRIAQILNTEKVPILGRTTYKGRPIVWTETVVYSILTSRATYGTYQPHTVRAGEKGRIRTPAGQPITNYYPAAITEDEYNAVRGILAGRVKVSGRRGSHVNIFAGLIYDARDGGSLTYKHLAGRSSAIIPVNAKHGTGAKWTSFLAVPFERAVRSRLAEVSVADLTAEGDDTAIWAEAKEGEIATKETAREKWRAKMDDPNLVDEVSAHLSRLNAEIKELTTELETIRREAADPISVAWKATRTADKELAENESDEAREKYRAALRRAVNSIWVLIVPGADKKGRVAERYAAVQVWFKNGTHRDYVIGYRPGGGGGPGKKARPVEVLKTKSELFEGMDSLDLRKPADAAALEKALAKASKALTGE